MSNRSVMPLILTAMFLLTSALVLVGPYEEVIVERTALKAEPVEFAPSNPGHTVFAQYVTSDNCGYCMSYGSPAHHQAKTSLPDNYVYISYHSASYGTTNDAESGNIAPIYGVQHLQETGGAPKTSFGDGTLEVGCGTNTCWDTYISSGGNMHSTAADYSVNVGQSDNGDGTSEITISAAYIGTGTAVSSLRLYAAVTEKVCNSHAYTDGSKGHNCWEAWLLNNGGYASNSGNVGGGTGFETVSLNSGPFSTNWTVPNNLVNGGATNINVVAALYGAWSANSFHESVYAASDGTMQPPIDVGVESFSISNSNFGDGFVPGDSVDLSVTVRNNGVDPYTDGGTIGFYYLQGNQENFIGSTPLNSLTKNGASDSQTFETTFDTSSIAVVAHGQTAFRARLTGLTGDGNGANNFAQDFFAHDVPPSATLPIAAGEDTVITREVGDDFVDFELKPSINDLVDDISTMTGELEVMDLITGQWSDEWVSGGDEVFGSGSTAYVLFHILPAQTAKAGDYDVRTRWIDSRAQTSDWIEYEDAFSLLNGLPMVIDGVFPTVKVDTTERISLVGLVKDPETPLNQLSISSSASEFLAWHPSDMEIEVLFASADQTRDASGNYLQQNLQLTMGDGTDSNTGTIRINLIENGAPRWTPVQAQTLDEGGSATLALSQFLSDTDSQGEEAPVSALTIEVIGNDAPDLITATMSGQTVLIETVDDDVFGEALLTLRAHDGVQHSETEMIVHVTNINDAPRLDKTGLENLRVKVGVDTWLDFTGRITDVDTDDAKIWTSVRTDVAGAVQWNPVNYSLKISFSTPGVKTIDFDLDDSEGGRIVIHLSVEVIDALPLIWDEDGTGDLSIAADTMAFGENPRITILNIGDHTLSDVNIVWQLCNTITNVCTDFGFQTEFGAFDVVAQSNLGLRLGDQIKIDVEAVDSDGFDRRSTVTKVFDAADAADSGAPGAGTADESDAGPPPLAEEGMETMTKAAIGGGLLIFVLIVILSLTFVMRRGDGANLDPYAQQLLAQGYGLEVATQHAAMYQEHVKQRSVEMVAAQSVPDTPATLPDYTHLPAGGDYRTGFNGETIYVEPSGTAWTMLPDNSFVRNQ